MTDNPIWFVDPDSGYSYPVLEVKEEVDIAYGKGWMPRSAEDMDRADAVAQES